MQMDSSVSQSFFHSIRSRELSSFRVRKRPFIDELASDFTEIGVVAVEHDAVQTPPLAISFCKASKNSHIFAVSDEDGYVSLFDSRKKLSSAASHQENAEKARISDWVAHQNAIFDVCWTKEDTRILTASGDQTIKIWDAQEKKCTGVLMGHAGSVKCLSSHPTNCDLVISGSRDGSFAIWDLRCKINSKSRCDEVCSPSTSMLKGAHPSTQARRGRRGKAAAASITSVLYLKDGNSVATAGAADSVVKFWDTRNLKSNVTQACPHPESSTQKGISSLSQDLKGVFLTASCMDNRIYLYNILQLDKGPKQAFCGPRIESFYVKSAISPDADHIVSGSSDGNAYIWKVTKPQVESITLKSHDGEVTAVDWCPSEIGKVATSADDFTVRIWNIQTSHCSSSRSPSLIRRRVMAIPSAECRKLLMNENEDPIPLTKDPGRSHSPDESLHQISSSSPSTAPLLSTPKAHKKNISSVSDSNETFEKTPEAAMKSPSSVLNPPSSLKRKTIRDYFLAAA
ncbi:denticleless protein homolog [Herrania umbratica]|uniref:Denticleless protein homolog n=1 Tax=Herrania umbratica TaxID=108875 RepID=A0A6J1BI34_9ROSI|nr:denticleless protein homolog [Herrania umbratica]